MEPIEVKPELVQIDLNKLCRSCLSESTELQSIFLSDNSTGVRQCLTVADMLMDFTNIQVGYLLHVFLYLQIFWNLYMLGIF